MGIGIEIGVIAVSILFWKLGRALEDFKWLPDAARPWVPAVVAFMGALTMSTTAPVGWLVDGMTWLTGMLPQGGLILGVLALWLLWAIIKGLSDGRLDKRDIIALAMLPVVSLAIGGPIGDVMNNLRTYAQDTTMMVVSSLTGA